jgi:predicted LPLAT superfamily acyltransferase
MTSSIPAFLQHHFFMDPSEMEQARFELVSAALVNFLPELPFAQHAAVFERIRLNQRLSIAEQGDWSLLSNLCMQGDARQGLALLKSKPTILCTMHTGSYRLLNLWLVREKIPFALVMGTKVLQQQGHLFREIYSSSGSDTAGLELIDAEQSRAGLQMLRALRAGKSLVLYLDGQTGAGEETAANKNNCPVRFLAQELYARKGIAWLAHVARCPLLPVLCLRRDNGEHTLHFFDKIEVEEKMDRERFARQTTQQLYEGFGHVIAADPGQWEGWLTIHQTARIVQDTSRMQYKDHKNGKNMVFNSFCFGIFKTAGQPILVEKHRYLFYPIENDLFELLQSCRQSGLHTSELSPGLLDDLLAKRILCRV